MYIIRTIIAGCFSLRYQIQSSYQNILDVEVAYIFYWESPTLQWNSKLKCYLADIEWVYHFYVVIHSSSFWQVFDKSVSYPLSVKCFSFLQLAPTPSQGPLEVWTENSKLFMTWCGGVLNNTQVNLQRSNICYWNFMERLSNAFSK